jgi:ABC-type methionine transport system ATPase subunit
MKTVTRRVYLTFPQSLVREPIVCEMYDRLQVKFNLRTASVNDEIGIIGMELVGEPERVEAAMQFFRDRGVRVEPIELDVIAG